MESRENTIGEFSSRLFLKASFRTKYSQDFARAPDHQAMFG
jgi:hypothetical protein